MIPPRVPLAAVFVLAGVAVGCAMIAQAHLRDADRALKAAHRDLDAMQASIGDEKAFAAAKVASDVHLADANGDLAASWPWTIASAIVAACAVISSVANLVLRQRDRPAREAA